MAKDVDESGVKKRKKRESPEKSNGTDPVFSLEDLKIKFGLEKELNPLPIYQRVTAHEEREATNRDPQDDLELYRESCYRLVKLVDEIAEKKCKKPEGWQDDIEEKKLDAIAEIMTLKSLNRIEKIRFKNSRESVNKVRQQVDVLQFQLQNLMCEIQHLKKEVDKCLMFKSKPLGVDLVSVEEFFEAAPPSISRPEITKTDEHQLQLARLEWELRQRKELALLCNELQEKKNSLSGQIKKKVNDLESLAPLIKDVLAVTKPMQEKLGLPSSCTSSVDSEISSLLPCPLYFLYVQAKGYSEAWDKSLTVEINGDIEEAKHMKPLNPILSDNDLSDRELTEQELKTIEKEKKKKFEKKRKRLFAKHPLTVKLKITFKDDSFITLEFTYYLMLHIITVKPSLTLANNVNNSSALELTKNENILLNLFPNDYGIESPNVANYYQLKEIGVDEFDSTKYGLPYLWVQRLGGLDFGCAKRNKKNDRIDAKEEIAKSSLSMTVKDIKRRVKARIALVRQVLEIEQGIVFGPQNMKFVKSSCSIKQWENITWNDFVNMPAAKHFAESPYVSDHDIYFKATVTRGQAKLTVLIAVKPNYPANPPVFSLQLDWNDDIWTASNNTDIIDIEREVNCYWKELVSNSGWAHTLLTLQMHRVMICFDILLECLDPQQFSAEKKTFFHPLRGRNRVHPYKYVPMGEGVFLQR
ncbi:hypothetical protein O3M35_010964 [Rhynocoris fuscipes]|uniref:THO complex subunit 5 homolog n=1 Tax=Rhynocoris fuscipes TaxID=488301 RepID=A0AAW1D2E6_9HEMI